MPASPRAQVIGLRQRKKEKTRVAIQEQAMRLFRERGYDETTVEDIAAAAEISPSTFFRYFPTKEDVVMYDVLDERLLELLRSQPPDLSPIQAFRNTLRVGMRQISPAMLESQRQRATLARTVPQLRARMLDEFARGSELLVNALASRTGRRRDDPDLRTIAGAIIGVLVVEWALGKRDDLREYIRAIDRSLDALEGGMPTLVSKPAARKASR